MPEDLKLNELQENDFEVSQAAQARGGSADESGADRVLSLDEVRNLAEGGKPAETLMNLVGLIAKRFRTDVCSVYLLEPDRANLVLAATVGLRRESVGQLRMGIHEGLVGLVAEQVRPVAVEQVPIHPRFKYFREAAKRPTSLFSACPLIDRGVLQGVLVVQTAEPRVFREQEIRMLTEAAAQVAPVVSEARTLDRFIAPAQERLWALARNSGGAGTRMPAGCSAIWTRCSWRAAESQSHFAAVSDSALRLERRARELVLHGRINYAYRRQQEYLQADRTWGAPHAGVLRLVRWPISPLSSDCTSRFRFIPAASACWPATTSRARPIWNSAGRHRPVLRPGILSPAARPGSAGSRRNTCETDVKPAADGTRDRKQRRAGRQCGSRPAAASIRAKGVAHESRDAAIFCCWIPTSKATLPKTAN